MNFSNPHGLTVHYSNWLNAIILTREISSNSALSLIKSTTHSTNLLAVNWMVHNLTSTNKSVCQYTTRQSTLLHLNSYISLPYQHFEVEAILHRSSRIRVRIHHVTINFPETSQWILVRKPPKGLQSINSQALHRGMASANWGLKTSVIADIQTRQPS